MATRQKLNKEGVKDPTPKKTCSKVQCLTKKKIENINNLIQISKSVPNHSPHKSKNNVNIVNKATSFFFYFWLNNKANSLLTP